MNIKETLKMPKTDFEMRGNLSKKEPIFLKEWEEDDLFFKMNENKSKDLSFVLHDGPPYANGAIHCGTTVNRSLKDIIIRHRNMSGFYTPFVPGWDTHGLPIEVKVTKSGVNRKTTPVNEFRKHCHDYALSQVDVQRNQFQRLGVVGDFKHPYLTLDKHYEATQIRLFKTMALKGYIYKGFKPVYWSPSSESALAEAEIEYHDVESYSIYVAFDVKDGKGLLDNDSKLVIWTTTPWTIPANLAISVHPRFVYGLYDTNKGKILILEKFKDRLSEELKLENVKLLKEFKGEELEGITCYHPLYRDKESLVIVGEHVTDDAGTGLVHTAPGHGLEDYVVSLKYHLPIYCPVDSVGKFDDSVGPRLQGLFYEDANEVVLEMLKENNSLLAVSKFVHSYPHDWRTKKPLIFRATPQWFFKIEPLKEKLLDAIKEVKWKPSWGETRMANMIKDRNDWCISRQRLWGVPIPIIYCEDETPIMEEEVFDHIADLFDKYGSDVWFEKEAKELLPEGYKNEHSPNGEFHKEKDIMDVWFDSGSSFAYALIDRKEHYPADLYLEGSDQYRGWFNSSLICSVACFDKAPYKQVISHGWVVDENLRKMSKSLGNGVNPNEIVNVYGADVLRLYTSTISYDQDMRISDDIIKQCSEIYRKLRNTFRFLLGNLNEGFDPKNMITSRSFIDSLILNKLHTVQNDFIDAMNNFDFASAMSKMLTFLSFDMSSFYLDITKDILYCEDVNSVRRKEVQATIYEVLYTSMRLLNPILPFTMYEVNKFLPGHTKDNPTYYPYPEKVAVDERLSELYSSFLKVRDDVLKELEMKRHQGLIGSSQEAEVHLFVKDEKLRSHLKRLDEAELARLFIVSKLTLEDKKNEGMYEGEVSSSCSNDLKHTKKCVRCWNYVDENKTHLVDGEVVCDRCFEVLNNIGEKHE